MIPFIGRRILFDVLVLVGVLFLVDALVYLSGDPVRALVPPSAGPEVIERVRIVYGFDQPLPVQFLRFLSRAVQGDFGTSVRFGTPALGVVLERVPLTLLLGLSGLLIGLAIALPLGILAARRRGTWVDLTARGVAVVGQGVPNFVMGPVLVLLFAVSLGWLPVSGASSPSSLILPAVVVGLGAAAGLTRILRSALLEELGRDYVRTARAKGVSDRAVVRRHALRNAAIPVVTFLAFDIAALRSGIVVVERVFQYPGMGLLATQAITNRDIPVIQAFVFLAALMIVTTNLLLDVAYAVIDPRVRVA
jgi:ABC-type dipeptide/oligopeptide/nickel transport system permease component